MLWLLYLQNWLWRRYLEQNVGVALDRLARRLGLPVARNHYGPSLSLRGETDFGQVRLVIRGGIWGPQVELKAGGRRQRVALDEIADRLEAWVVEGVEGAAEE